MINIISIKKNHTLYEILKSLVHDLFTGKTTNYVEKKPLETSKGTTSPKDLNIEGGAK